MSLQKISAITLCATAIGFFGCRDPFADCLPGFDEIDGECGKAGGSTSDTDPTTSGAPPECGNGMVEQGEECEPPGPGGYGKCKMDCFLDRHCGDGVQDPEEACDDGTNDGIYGGCMPGCQALAPRCGDNIHQMGDEACEDGNTVGADGCSADCQKVEVCGDDFTDEGEACDDNNTVGGDGCSADCKKVEVCGDNFVDVGEACDDDNMVGGDGCSADCKKIEDCGDGVLDVGEACDDGNQMNEDTCTNVCGMATCGDGFQQPGEACDMGMANSNTGACTLMCALPICGDKFVQPSEGEECDDGNTKKGDGCDACRHEYVIFVTKEPVTPDFGSVANADGICAAAANGLLGTYVAWLSASMDDAKGQLPAGKPLVRPDGVQVVTSSEELSDGTPKLINPVNVAPDGTTVMGFAWTGTNESGTSSGFHCSNWGVKTVGFQGAVGALEAITSEWTIKKAITCDQTDIHLYCFRTK